MHIQKSVNYAGTISATIIKTVFSLPLLSNQGLSLKFVQAGEHCMNHQPQKLNFAP